MKKPDDDDTIWTHVTRSVKAYPKTRAGLTPRKKPAKDSTAPRPKADNTPAPVAATPLPRARGTRPAPPRAAGFDTGAEASLKKRKWPIDGRIDLHGMTQAAAHAALTRFIRAAARGGRRTLIVITGKGSTLAGGGVLRRMLPLWLEEESLRPHILAFTQAHPSDGGTGAFYIRLRKSRD